MGKGDKKSRRGKIILGSYGVRRPKSSKNKSFVKSEVVPVVVEKVKKVTEKPKAEPKSKVKVVEDVVASNTEVAAASPKEVKKTAKKTVIADENSKK
jgi:30S ribosomal protein S31